MDLRPYQFEAAEKVCEKWEAGYKNVALVMPTGAGKTHTKTYLTQRMALRTICIAHRQELVLQISESLAAFKIYHRVIAPNSVVRFCAARHIKLYGQSFVDAQAPVSVAGVQTLLRRSDTFKHVQMWDVDEMHHVLPDNQWGKACALFPNAIGLGVTATPLRCDRKPLDGIFNALVEGPTMRELIGQGHLTDYRIFCPPQSVRRAELSVSKSTGEFKQNELRERMHNSQIVGDIVGSYLKLANGLRGLTFCVDVESAGDVANAYNAAGVPAQLVTGKTPDAERVQYLEQLASGELKQLVNVDLFGEGMDCPTLGVVSFGRPTQSYGLYAQQFGRVLRPAPGKDVGIVIDHVGNVVTHGLPDAPRVWSLAGEVRSVASDADAIPLRVCDACMQPYPRHEVCCPYCGNVPVPAGRSLPEQVDGDLEELDPTVLARMRGEIIPLNGGPPIPHGASNAIVGAKHRQWGELIEAQIQLRQGISFLAGAWRDGDGMSDREIHKRFYLAFGLTVPEALALRRADAVKLDEKIQEVLT